MVILAEQGRTVLRDLDRDPDRMDQVGEEARLVPRGPVAGQGRMGQDRTGLGQMGPDRMDRHGEEALERATSRQERPFCSRG